MKKIIFTLSVFLLIGIADSFSQSYKIIVNPANEVSSLSEKEASDIFLKRNSKWNNGNSITPIDQSPGSSVRSAFTEAVHGRSVSAIRSFWQQAAFSGAGSPPIEKGSDAEIVDFVKSNPGAIGYISATANSEGTKTITVK